MTKKMCELVIPSCHTSAILWSSHLTYTLLEIHVTKGVRFNSHLFLFKFSNWSHLLLNILIPINWKKEKIIANPFLQHETNASIMGWGKGGRDPGWEVEGHFNILEWFSGQNPRSTQFHLPVWSYCTLAIPVIPF